MHGGTHSKYQEAEARAAMARLDYKYVKNLISQ